MTNSIKKRKNNFIKFREKGYLKRYKNQEFKLN